MVSSDELRRLVSQVPLEKVDALLNALEITCHGEDAVTLLKRWSDRKKADTRKILTFHLKRIGLVKLASKYVS